MKESDSSHFWSNVFFPSVASVRKEKIFQPKAKRISELLAERQFHPVTICDVGAGHGLLLDSLKPFFPQSTFFAVEPDPTSSKICKEKGFVAIQDSVENIKLSHDGFDLVVSFEVIEHVFDLKRFLQSLYNITRSGGYMLITGLCYEGFDILSLQEHSKSISPPHHLNFVSLDGIKVSLKEIGFDDVKVWTPGKLDVDIVLNSNIPSEFLRVLRSRGASAISEFQHFLAKHNMSSHMWILAKK